MTAFATCKQFTEWMKNNAVHPELWRGVVEEEECPCDSPHKIYIWENVYEIDHTNYSGMLQTAMYHFEVGNQTVEKLRQAFPHMDIKHHTLDESGAKMFVVEVPIAKCINLS